MVRSSPATAMRLEPSRVQNVKKVRNSRGALAPLNGAAVARRPRNDEPLTSHRPLRDETR